MDGGGQERGRGWVGVEDSGDLGNLVKAWTGRQKEEQVAWSRAPRP